ncbi:AraC family transcriptional regulator [Burkholderia sp. Bp9140]|uniref:AraC family transcriptional regulator n=1 Tax=Burkholderia sp. Bp9140 TaxID=2184572 RepID=UPI000F5624F8|nr:AraC family transcriptional regulator [Burkholderia sp. Bp9140]RQR49341.1 AraC family transcriptional regulator [Burkholderia sp. Bp9140]
MEHFSSSKDWIYQPQIGNLERIEAYFAGHAYSPHRHDTYAIGRTLAGVQSFHYRGTLQHSLPNGTMVLHPDEEHDGHAGTTDGFQYRMIYIAPALIQQVLGGKSLPFIPEGISRNPRLFKATDALLQNLDSRLTPLEEDDALYDLTVALSIASGQKSKRVTPDYRAGKLAMEFIHDSLERQITLEELADYSGRDRWSLSRDFRDLFGTSPHRYITMRRLDIVKNRLLLGDSLVEASIYAGFYDQSHMTRQFSKAFGLPPAKWLAIRGILASQHPIQP